MKDEKCQILTNQYTIVRGSKRINFTLCSHQRCFEWAPTKDPKRSEESSIVCSLSKCRMRGIIHVSMMPLMHVKELTGAAFVLSSSQPEAIDARGREVNFLMGALEWKKEMNIIYAGIASLGVRPASDHKNIHAQDLMRCLRKQNSECVFSSYRCGCWFFLDIIRMRVALMRYRDIIKYPN